MRETKDGRYVMVDFITMVEYIIMVINVVEYDYGCPLYGYEFPLYGYGCPLYDYGCPLYGYGFP